MPIFCLNALVNVGFFVLLMQGSVAGSTILIVGLLVLALNLTGIEMLIQRFTQEH